jgi:uncharacterized protein with von Willebrand factor type A (vWA) domain
MLIDFFLHLKANRLPVSIKEFLALLEALQQHVIEHSLDDFYVLSRAILVKDETHFDKFDRAFGEYFKGVEALPGMEVLIPEEWLRQAVKKHLTDAERAKLEKLGWDKLMETFKKRLAEQKERHSGGSKWIGSGGTSPFGHGGTHPEGIRVGGKSENRSAVKVWEKREYRNLDDSVETRHAQHQGRPASPAPLCPPGRRRGTRSRRHHRRYRAQRRLARSATCGRSATTPSRCCCFSISAARWTITSASARNSSRPAAANSSTSNTTTSTTVSTTICGG